MRLASILAATAILSTSPAYAQWLSGWMDYNGHQYRVTEEMDWFAAEALAESVGGHLVTVDDAAENMWILNTLGPFATSNLGLWLGLFQPAGSAEPAGGWEWVSGDSVNYTNWDTPASPNNNTIFGNENAAHMWIPPGVDPAGTWDDFAGEAFFLPGVVEVVPEPSTALLLAAASLLSLRRRRQAASGHCGKAR